MKIETLCVVAILCCSIVALVVLWLPKESVEEVSEGVDTGITVTSPSLQEPGVMLPQIIRGRQRIVIMNTMSADGDPLFIRSRELFFELQEDGKIELTPEVECKLFKTCVCESSTGNSFYPLPHWYCEKRN